jgi:hypothetical protein
MSPPGQGALLPPALEQMPALWKMITQPAEQPGHPISARHVLTHVPLLSAK